MPESPLLGKGCGTDAIQLCPRVKTRGNRSRERNANDAKRACSMQSPAPFTGSFVCRSQMLTLTALGRNGQPPPCHEAFILRNRDGSEIGLSLPEAVEKPQEVAPQAPVELHEASESITTRICGRDTSTVASRPPPS